MVARTNAKNVQQNIGTIYISSAAVFVSQQSVMAPIRARAASNPAGSRQSLRVPSSPQQIALRLTANTLGLLHVMHECWKCSPIELQGVSARPPCCLLLQLGDLAVFLPMPPFRGHIEIPAKILIRPSLGGPAGLRLD